MIPDNNLRIENPCPFVPTRMNKDGDTYFCKSCSKHIVDFRGRSPEAIQSALTPTTCGIFTADQLPGQQPMLWSRKLMLYAFTVLSFLGFSVKPLSAQTTPVIKDSVQINNKPNTTDQVQADAEAVKENCIKPKKNGLFRRKKKQQRLTGCPVF